MKLTLEQDFKARKTFYANRASAIFPIHFVGLTNDLIISFLNYWTIKNELPADSIIVNLRIYDQDGSLHCRELIDEIEDNNVLSIRDHILEEHFYGMVEIEVVSTSNLAFTFPALNAIYKSNSLYSCVHSAGRIKGADEHHTSSPTVETNWTCKFEEGIKPFFHYINGNTTCNSEFRVSLYSPTGEEVDHRLIAEDFNSFASKIYFIDDIFGSRSFDKDMYVGVWCLNNSVFRRMIVGNFHQNLNHLEVTHSFPLQELEDYAPKVDDEDTPVSFLACYTEEQLELKTRVFATNCRSDFTFGVRAQDYGDMQLKPVDSQRPLNNGYGIISVPSKTQFLLLELYGRVPSRFNTNFLYTVKGVDSVFSTDIATGAKSSVYPPKVSHWGSGVVGEGYDFILMLRNNKHTRNSLIAKGKLQIYGLALDESFNIEIEPESSTAITLSALSQTAAKLVAGEVKIFTWFVKLDQACSESFWISYRKSDGCILGEHGF